MPQSTLFDGWSIVRMSVDVELPINRPGGRISVRFEDENGRAAGGRTVQWMRPRDCSDLGFVLKRLGDAFMFAPQLECIATLPNAVAEHMPELPRSGALNSQQR